MSHNEIAEQAREFKPKTRKKLIRHRTVKQETENKRNNNLPITRQVNSKYFMIILALPDLLIRYKI